jgi:hypothetical protein
MPALSFQSQFVPMIVDGMKHHTIRRKRKKCPIARGQLLRLYTGMRTKQCRLIRDAHCSSVVPVVIYPKLGRVVLDGKMLSLDDTLRFAIRDGFANQMEFFRFFERYPQEVLEREMEVIYWR